MGEIDIFPTNIFPPIILFVYTPNSSSHIVTDNNHMSQTITTTTTKIFKPHAQVTDNNYTDS